MASFATDGFRFTHTENRRSLRNCASNNRFTAQARTSPPPLPPPLLSGSAIILFGVWNSVKTAGETVACEEDGIETQIEDLEGETQVLDGGREMCVRDQVLMANLEGDTQVVDDLRDGLEMGVGNVGGETQFWDDFGGQTQVDDAEYGYDTELINLGAETEVQDDEDCVRNVCSQFLRSGVDFDLAGAGGTSNESGIVKGVFCDSSTSLVNEKKQGQSYGKPLDQDSNYVSATPPTTVDLDPGSFQRSFTSIRTASLRASGLAARCKALVETGISAPHAQVQNDYEISSVGHTPRSAHNHDIAEQGVNNDASMCKPVCSVVRKLFNEEPLAENRNATNEGDGEEGANTPQLPLPDNDDEVAGLSYVGSQEPGDSTQAEAFDFIERFVNDNASDMLLEADNVPERRTISKPTLSAKSFLKFSKKSTVLRQPVDQAVSFNWDEELEDEGGGDFFCKMKEKIFKGGHKQRSLPQPQKSRRCAELVGDKSDKMKFCDKRTVTQSDSKLLLFNSDRNSKVLDTAKANIRRNLETELNGELPIRCTEEPTETIARRNDIQAMFSVGPDTQIAAEAMEALFGGEPISSANADANANANQWNSASLSAVDSKSRQSAKIREFREKASSDGSVIQKSQRKIHEKKKKKIHGTILNGHGKDEVNGTHTPNRSCVIDKANPFMSGRRATRSMVQNQGNMLLNQAVVAQNISKDMNNETNLQIGVAIPKGKWSRNCVSTEAKYDKTHSDVGPLKLDDSILHESRPNVKTSGAMTSSRRQSARHLRSHLVKSQDCRKLKSKKEANKTSSNLRCNEGSSSKRFVTSPARASCSFDAADIYRDVVRTNILDNHSAKGTAVDAADCGVPVEVVGAVPITDKPSQRSSNPPESAFAISDKHSEIRNARAVNRCRRQLPINLSRSSLRKEISALLSNSPKSLSDLKRKILLLLLLSLTVTHTLHMTSSASATQFRNYRSTIRFMGLKVFRIWIQSAYTWRNCLLNRVCTKFSSDFKRQVELKSNSLLKPQLDLVQTQFETAVWLDLLSEHFSSSSRRIKRRLTL
uniref:Uncharacterized protein n=1 Tax=Kalanchoe fedtschenkoi TaxID=63787 RepID=A0A7N0VMS4_KALFE